MNCTECGHEMHKTKFPIAGGAWQCRWQCTGCGYKMANSTKKPPNFEALPLFNKELHRMYQQKNASHTGGWCEACGQKAELRMIDVCNTCYGEIKDGS